MFAERGWIATSSLGIDVMEDALRLGARGDLNAAEELLAGWFDEEKLRIFAILRSRRFHRVPEREEQLEEAIRLHHEGRYWSALPLILIAADGFASDVAGYSAFKEGADLSAFDSVVGHPTSLPNLIRAVTRTRRKSTAEPVPLPYRHGILHGQDLGYADRVTCAKGWMLFVALVDWAIDKQSESERRKKDDERRSFTWQKAIESMQRNKATRDALDAWTPREVAAPLPEPLDPASPEAALLSYLEYWKAGNYGGMGQFSVNFVGYSPGKLAGQARSDAGPVQLIGHTFLRLEQSTPVMARGEVRLRLKGFDREAEEVLEIGCLRLLPDGDLAMPNDPEGRWLVKQKVVWDARTVLQRRGAPEKAGN